MPSQDEAHADTSDLDFVVTFNAVASIEKVEGKWSYRKDTGNLSLRVCVCVVSY
jgi:hypothetical protein